MRGHWRGFQAFGINRQVNGASLDTFEKKKMKKKNWADLQDALDYRGVFYTAVGTKKGFTFKQRTFAHTTEALRIQ